MEAEACPHDYSHLPEVVWMKILSYVPFTTRCRVSETCQTLRRAFEHPSLWDRVEVVLSSLWQENYPPNYTFIAPERQLQLIQRFGKYIKTLALVYVSHQFIMPEDCREVIAALTEYCRLEYLIVEVEIVKTKRDLFFAGDSAKFADLDPICELLVRSDRLQGLTLRAWPLYRRVRNMSVFDVLRTNRIQRRSQFRQLHLFWECASQATWASMNIMLPSPENTENLLKPFTGLHSLALRSSMISENLILLLSDSARAPLLHFYILVTYSAHASVQHVPSISDEAWGKLAAVSPDLRVEYTVMTRMPLALLISLLNPSVPLGALEFMKYSNLNKDILQWITEYHTETMYKFVSYSIIDEDLDEALIEFVTKCTQLTHLVFLSKIHCSTVRTLAELRAAWWHKFQVLEDNISTQSLQEPETEEEEDLVVRQSADGSYELAHGGAAAAAPVEEGLHWETIEELVRHVSSCLGYSWLPLHSRMFEVHERVRVNDPLGRAKIEQQYTSTPAKYPIARGWPWVGE